MVHRDIKPANVLLQAGKPVIADFGIALAVGLAGGGRLTETGLSLGTPRHHAGHDRRDAVVWPALIDIARDRSRPEDVREQAVFWVGGARVYREFGRAGSIKDPTARPRGRPSRPFSLIGMVRPGARSIR